MAKACETIHMLNGRIDVEKFNSYSDLSGLFPDVPYGYSFCPREWLPLLPRE